MQEKTTLKSVRYFSSACDYAIKKLPLQDEVYKNAELANVALKENFSSIKYFADILLIDEIILDELELEFANLRMKFFHMKLKNAVEQTYNESRKKLEIL